MVRATAAAAVAEAAAEAAWQAAARAAGSLLQAEGNEAVVVWNNGMP